MSRDKKGYIAKEEAADVNEWLPPAMQDKAINQEAIDRLRRARKLIEKKQQERIKQAQGVEQHKAEIRQVPEYDGPQKQFYLDPRASQTKKIPSAISELTEEQILQVEAKYQDQNSQALNNSATESLKQEQLKQEQLNQQQAEPSDEEKLQAELDQIKQKAHQEGYEAGKLQAEAEAKEQLENAQASFQAQTQLIEQLIHQLQNRVAKIDDEVEHEIVTLIKLFVKQIIKREIQLDPTHLISLLREAIQVLPMNINHVITVDMHPQEAEIVGEVLHIDAENGAWKILANPSLESGAMRLTMGESTIDTSVEKQIQYLISQAFDVRNQSQKQREPSLTGGSNDLQHSEANVAEASVAEASVAEASVLAGSVTENSIAENSIAEDSFKEDNFIEEPIEKLTETEIINNTSNEREDESQQQLLDKELSSPETDDLKSVDSDND